MTSALRCHLECWQKPLPAIRHVWYGPSRTPLFWKVSMRLPDPEPTPTPPWHWGRSAPDPSCHCTSRSHTKTVTLERLANAVNGFRNNHEIQGKDHFQERCWRGEGSVCSPELSCSRQASAWGLICSFPPQSRTLVATHSSPLSSLAKQGGDEGSANLSFCFVVRANARSAQFCVWSLFYELFVKMWFVVCVCGWGRLS